MGSFLRKAQMCPNTEGQEAITAGDGLRAQLPVWLFKKVVYTQVYKPLKTGAQSFFIIIKNSTKDVRNQSGHCVN